MQRLLGDVQADNIDFGTHNYTPRRVGEGDFCQVSYFLAASPQSDKLSGSAGVPPGFSLWRRRNPRIGLDPLSGGTREEIARGLRGLKFEYFDGFDWYNTWGDPDGRAKTQDSWRDHPNLVGMPEAVRITLWFQTGAGSPKPGASQDETSEPTLAFQTVCRLNLAGVALRNTSSPSANNRDANQPPQATPEGGPQ